MNRCDVVRPPGRVLIDPLFQGDRRGKGVGAPDSLQTSRVWPDVRPPWAGCGGVQCVQQNHHHEAFTPKREASSAMSFLLAAMDSMDCAVLIPGETSNVPSAVVLPLQDGKHLRVQST